MDQSRFINTYIDIIVTSLMEQIKTNLQLQTQVKVHEFVVEDKDKVIADLNRRLTENVVAEDWRVKYEAAESNYSAAMGKLRHMDSLLAQVADMKSQINQKDDALASLAAKEAELASKNGEIAALREELEQIKSAKKVINTKGKKKDELPLPEEEQVKPTDDF